jgi:hypothetical protein
MLPAPQQGEQAIRTGIMSQRYPANHTFDPDIIRLMIPLNCALGFLNYQKGGICFET